MCSGLGKTREDSGKITLEHVVCFRVRSFSGKRREDLGKVLKGIGVPKGCSDTMVTVAGHMNAQRS